jgi:hypothetical protein
MNKEINSIEDMKLYRRVMKIFTNSFISLSKNYNVFDKEKMGQMNTYGKSLNSHIEEEIMTEYNNIKNDNSNISDDELIEKLEWYMKTYLIYVYGSIYLSMGGNK